MKKIIFQTQWFSVICITLLKHTYQISMQSYLEECIFWLFFWVPPFQIMKVESVNNWPFFWRWSLPRWFRGMIFGNFFCFTSLFSRFAPESLKLYRGNSTNVFPISTAISYFRVIFNTKIFAWYLHYCRTANKKLCCIEGSRSALRTIGKWNFRIFRNFLLTLLVTGILVLF